MSTLLIDTDFANFSRSTLMDRLARIRKHFVFLTNIALQCKCTRGLIDLLIGRLTKGAFGPTALAITKL